MNYDTNDDPAEHDCAAIEELLAGEQHWRKSLQSMLDSVQVLLEQNGCDCECDHHWEEHDNDCDRCLACRVGEAIR